MLNLGHNTDQGAAGQTLQRRMQRRWQLQRAQAAVEEAGRCGVRWTLQKVMDAAEDAERYRA